MDGATTDPGTDPAEIDLGSLGSCTAIFGLNKATSRYVSFDVQGSLADSAVVGDDLIPVFEFVNPVTSEFDHCIMEEGWDPELPVWDVTDPDDLDFVADDPAELSFAVLNEGTVEEFFLGSSGSADSVLRVERLVDGGTRRQFLLPLDVPNQYQPAAPAEEEEAERILLVPSPDFAFDLGDIVYDPSIPANTSAYEDDGQVATLEILATGIELVRTLLATTSSNDADLLAEFDALMADLVAFGPGNCSQEPTEEFLLEAIRATANPAFVQALVDDGVLVDYVSYLDPPVDYCLEIHVAAIIAGFAAEVTDSRVMTVTAGELPATGVDTADLFAMASAALAVGTVIVLVRRRRPSFV